MKQVTIGTATLVGLLLTLAASISTAQAQTNFREFEFDSTKTYVIELLDGTEITGSYIGKTIELLIISTSSIPRIEIPFSQIKSIKAADASSIRGETYWFPNPNATRYLFAPSGFNLKKGEGYYQNSYLVLNSVNYGITDNISIGGSIELLSTLSTLAEGSFRPVVLITPKVGFPVAKDLNMGAGLLFVSIPEIDNNPLTGAGIAYGIATYGNIEHNATLGLGWGFVDGYWAKRPLINISGMTRIRRNMSLVTENWIIPIDNDFDQGRYYEVVSYGVRFIGKTISVDLAFINNRDIADVLLIGMPYVDFVIKL
jgi:hypothetical protein